MLKKLLKKQNRLQKKMIWCWLLVLFTLLEKLVNNSSLDILTETCLKNLFSYGAVYCFINLYKSTSSSLPLFMSLILILLLLNSRSEERRVGKEGRSRWAP